MFSIKYIHVSSALKNYSKLTISLSYLIEINRLRRYGKKIRFRLEIFGMIEEVTLQGRILFKVIINAYSYAFGRFFYANRPTVLGRRNIEFSI